MARCGSSKKPSIPKHGDSRRRCWDRWGREIRHKGTRTTTTNVLGRVQTVARCLTCTSRAPLAAHGSRWRSEKREVTSGKGEPGSSGGWKLRPRPETCNFIAVHTSLRHSSIWPMLDRNVEPNCPTAGVTGSRGQRRHARG